MKSKKTISIMSIVIWASLFFLIMLFSELEIPYTRVLLAIILVATISKSFKEYKVSFMGVAIFAITLTITLPLTVSTEELDTIYLSVRNVEKHGNNVYIKTNNILDNGEITLEDMKYLEDEKNELSQWCKVFDRQSEIIGISKKSMRQVDYARNVFENQDKDTSKIFQRVTKLNKIELTEDERPWLEGIKNRSYEILMTKIIQEGNSDNDRFAKSKVRKLYSELYKEIHEVE